jgi:CheY-like chemotaxis protein
MSKRILLVDDSVTIQKVVELTFEGEDLELVVATSGGQAVAKVRELRPALVLCDVSLPEKNGYEVCDDIKKDAGLRHVPVLFLTGAFEPFDEKRAAKVGCDGFLAKPFEPQALIRKVKELLSKTA